MLAARRSAHTAGSGALSYDATILADNPVIFLKCNEGSGTTATDATGNGHNGTYTGGFTLGVAGPCSDGETGVQLNGTSGYITVPDSAALQLQPPLTIEFWANQTDHAGYYYPIWKSASNSVGFGIWSDTANLGKLNGWTSGTNVPAENTTVLGAWSYFAATWDGSTWVYYRDAASPNNGTHAFSHAITNSADPLNWGSGQGAFFKGSLAKLALYNVALSQAKIQAHYGAR